MIRIAVCDDEESITQNMEDVLEKCARELKAKIEVEVFYDGVTLLDYMGKTNSVYDVVFLDIEMQRMNGLETAEKLREVDRNLLIVYVTSHENYALRAYKVHPYDFLVKPIDEDAVRKCFKQIYEILKSGEQYYDYNYKRKAYRIRINDILYLMSDKRTIKIYMKDGSTRVHYGKLDEVEERLSSMDIDFWRIHKSALVNSRYIYEKGFDHVVLADGQRLSISREYERKLNAKYIQKLTNRMED